MKNKILKHICMGLGLMSLVGCTDLSETTYSIIPQDKFYQTKDNIYQSFVRPFGHAYWLCTRGTYLFGELSADQLMIVQKEEHWYDKGAYFRLHYHTWTIDDWFVDSMWKDTYRGIVQCNSVISDFNRLDPEKFGVTREEFNDLIAQERILRAWMYYTIFETIHNIPVVTAYPSSELPSQSTPKQTFEFIENELLESLPQLSKKTNAGGNGLNQGLWNQGGAAALLARLYMNAKWLIGEDKSAECEKICQDIIDGKYGVYEIDDRWDAPFDWNNDKSDELLYAFASSYGGAHWCYSGGLHWFVAPFKAAPYFGFTDWGNCNAKFSLQPGLDLQGNEYTFDNGKPVRKFQKYADDYRLKKYRNKGHGKREGLFLYGTLDYQTPSGETKYVRADNDAYQLYIRDQVGIFQDTDPSSASPRPSSGKPTPESAMPYGDQNSGWYMVKYPIYASDDPAKIEADYALLRLAEIYYNLAEIKFNKGDKATAAKLLNKVRKRNYPAGSPSLYPEDGSQLTKQELLDEWGREFLGEGHRRRVLCRFGLYNSGKWWDKNPDADNHTMWVPLSRTALMTNPNLVQNDGYPGIE